MRPLLVSVIALLILSLSVLTAGANNAKKPCTPKIDEVNPASVFVGDSVVIRGSCLTSGSVAEQVKLSHGKAHLRIVSASDAEIVAAVSSPDSADTLTLASAAGGASVAFEVKNWVEPPADEFRAGVIEVLLKSGADINDVATQLGGQVVERIFADWDFPELQGLWRLTVEGDTIARVQEWAGHVGVEWAQPDIIRSASVAAPPNDPCYPDPTPPACDVVQYEHFGINYGDDGQWGMQRISAEGAWPIERGEASVKLAVMDTGVDGGSGELFSELGSRIVISQEFSEPGLPGAPEHGTLVAGVAAARADNATGIAGVAPDVSLVSYKVFGPVTAENPDGFRDEDWLNALLFAIGDDVDVVNMSFAGETFGGGGFDILEQLVIDAAHVNGIVMVTVAGNSGFDLDAPNIFVWPAEYDNVITVAATDDADGRGYFNEPFQLQIPSTGFGSAVDISAPGVDILSTNWSGGGGGPDGKCAGAKYCADSGTSFSAPMVAGVAALLASRGFFACEIVETITGTDQFGNAISADPITWGGGGVGRLNAQKALEWWGGGPMVSDTVWPEGAIIHERGSSDRYVNNGGMAQLVTSFDERNDQCVPPAVFDAIGDPDGDGWINSADNCPFWPNANQQLPVWFGPSPLLSLTAGDDDCDGYSTTVFVTQRASEEFIGTDPVQHCAATTTPYDERGPDFDEPLSPWTPDINDDGLASLQDVLAFSPHFNAIYPDPAYSARFDWNGDLRVTLSDVNSIAPFYLLRCD